MPILDGALPPKQDFARDGTKYRYHALNTQSAD